MITFACPCCKVTLQAGDGQVSTKMICPKCGQKLMTPPARVPVPSLKTTLAIDVGQFVNSGPAPIPSQPAPPPPIPSLPPSLPPSKRRRRRRQRYDPDAECTYCGSHEEPIVREEMAQEAWIVFIVLLLVFFPICWIPLICMKKKTEVCYDCGRVLPIRR